MVEVFNWGLNRPSLNPSCFLSVDIDDKGADATVRQASMVEREWLPIR